MLVTDYDDKHIFILRVYLLSVDRHAKVLEALTFCSEIRSCERFVPILQGLSIGDVQMKVCLLQF